MRTKYKLILITSASLTLSKCSGQASIQVQSEDKTKVPYPPIYISNSPNLNPQGNYFGSPVSVSITVANSNSTICYSLTASPTCNPTKSDCAVGTRYSAPVTVSTSGTLRAVTCTPGMNDQLVTSDYSIVTTTPTVNAISPISGATKVQRESQISVEFSEDMASGTITSGINTNCNGTVQLSYDNFSSCVPMASANPIFSIGTRKANFTPAKSLIGGRTYQLRVTTGALNLGGHGLATTWLQTPGFQVDDYISTYPSGNALSSPWGIVADNTGNVFVADRQRHSILKISPTGVVSVFAGSGTCGDFDATGVGAQFCTPYGITMDSAGNLYVADYGFSTIRKISQAGVVTTIAGNGVAGYRNGPGSYAKFDRPMGVAVDSAGIVYVADSENHAIRAISTNGDVSTFSGGNGPTILDGNAGSNSAFLQPNCVTISGNYLYVCDYNAIRRVSLSTGGAATLYGSASDGYIEGSGTSARFWRPYGIAIDDQGTMYIADSFNNRIRIAPIVVGGSTSLMFGSVAGYLDGNSSTGLVYSPFGITYSGASRSIFVTDAVNKAIRRIN